MQDPSFERLIRDVATATVRELQNQPTIPCVWVDEIGAGRYLSISPRMLQDHRRDGTGPVFHKAGGRLVRYRLSDLDAFMVAQGEARS